MAVDVAASPEEEHLHELAERELEVSAQLTADLRDWNVGGHAPCSATKRAPTEGKHAPLRNAPPPKENTPTIYETRPPTAAKRIFLSTGAPSCRDALFWGVARVRPLQGAATRSAPLLWVHVCCLPIVLLETRARSFLAQHGIT